MKLKKVMILGVVGVVGMLFLVMVCARLRGSGELPGEEQYSSGIGITASGSEKLVTLQLADSDNSGSKQIRMQDDEWVISGFLDMDRRYFEGSLTGDGNEFSLIDFATGESRLLEENLSSFLLGDYYVRCSYRKQTGEMDLLIFYCPVEK